LKGFTKKYQCHRLVYYESYQDVRVAIAREKQLKRWRREKKIFLIEKLNSRWQDLAESWGREMRFRGQSMGKIPETAWWRKDSRDLSTLPYSQARSESVEMTSAQSCAAPMI
jgi:hypothetical protein